MDNSRILIVNNTGDDISIVQPYLLAYAKGEELHEDIVDIFEVERIVDGDKVKVVVDFKAD